jgi:hypothetical protein
MTAMVLSASISYSELSLLVHTINSDEDVVEEEFGILCTEDTRVKIGIWDSQRTCLASTRISCDVNDYRNLTRFPFVENVQLKLSLEEITNNTPSYDIKLHISPLEINLNKNSTNLLLSTFSHTPVNKQLLIDPNTKYFTYNYTKASKLVHYKIKNKSNITIHFGQSGSSSIFDIFNKLGTHEKITLLPNGECSYSWFTILQAKMISLWIDEKNHSSEPITMSTVGATFRTLMTTSSPVTMWLKIAVTIF